jgi:hypothetical protein
MSRLNRQNDESSDFEHQDTPYPNDTDDTDYSRGFIIPPFSDLDINSQSSRPNSEESIVSHLDEQEDENQSQIEYPYEDNNYSSGIDDDSDSDSDSSGIDDDDYVEFVRVTPSRDNNYAQYVRSPVQTISRSVNSEEPSVSQISNPNFSEINTHLDQSEIEYPYENVSDSEYISQSESIISQPIRNNLSRLTRTTVTNDLHSYLNEVDSSFSDRYDLKYEEDSDIYTNILSNPNTIVDSTVKVLDKCLNESPVSLMNYDEEDLNDLFIIYLQNQQGKFIKGSCLRRDEMKDILKSDLGTIPSYLMSIYKTPTSGRHDDLLTGLTGKPTGKIVVRIPTNQIYVTFGSLKRVLSTNIKEWYALPLYGGKLRRVGNLGGIYGASMNHGQVPGFKIYKLFTRLEIDNVKPVQESSDDYPHVYQYDTMKSLFELINIPLNVFINNVLNQLINTQVNK